MIIIVDYGLGNLKSIKNMLKHVGFECSISSDFQEIKQASHLILPGVGAFDNGMQNLRDSGLLEILDLKAKSKDTRILGICLGMQLMCKTSEEGELPGLGWIDAEVKRFRPKENSLRVPHMGWNRIYPRKESSLLKGLPKESRFYFVHSYFPSCNSSSVISAETEYGERFTSIFEQGHIAGVQFHPEKSHKFGMQLLKNFGECF